MYDFDNVEVISSGERDPDAEGVEGLSASRMRLAASENDFKAFKKVYLKIWTMKEKRNIYNCKIFNGNQ